MEYQGGEYEQIKKRGRIMRRKKGETRVKDAHIASESVLHIHPIS